MLRHAGFLKENYAKLDIAIKFPGLDTLGYKKVIPQGEPLLVNMLNSGACSSTQILLL